MEEEIQKIEPLLARADAGDAAASAELFATLYDQLHRLARHHVRVNGGGADMATTTLLHEAYLSLCGRSDASFAETGRFMAYASKVMRGLLIDRLRSQYASKHGGDLHITVLDTQVAENVKDVDELERIGAAVDELAKLEPDLAQIVDLKFFCGFSFQEIAAMRGISERTLHRRWDKARLFLKRALQND